MIKRYAGYGLLIINELGYVPFSEEGAELVFQVLAERHEKRPVIITTNMGFGDWTQIFGAPNLRWIVTRRSKTNYVSHFSIEITQPKKQSPIPIPQILCKKLFLM